MSTISLAEGQGLRVRQGFSDSRDAETAVQELAAQINQPDTRLTLVFFSDEYDQQQLARSLAANLPGVVAGCTTAGQLCAAGFQRGGISGATLAGEALEAVSYLIHPMSTIAEQVENIAGDVHERMSRTARRGFGLLLVDGLCSREELLAASLYRSLGDVPIVGGSAGDMLKFERTFVYHDGRMLQDGAVFTLILSTHPFSTFKHQHFEPTSTRLVITEADPTRRVVTEINGETAVEGYARAISVPVKELNATVFSRHPLMLRYRDDYYIRSIAGVEPDGSLRFYCAIEKGLVLHVGQGTFAQEKFERHLAHIREKIGEPAVIIGCDCILRRLELEDRGIAEDIGRLYAANRIIGFSTYGEQFNSVHVNQTFTGVAIAG